MFDSATYTDVFNLHFVELLATFGSVPGWTCWSPDADWDAELAEESSFGRAAPIVSCQLPSTLFAK